MLRVLAGPGCAASGKRQYFERNRTSPDDVFIDAGELYAALGGREDSPSRTPALLRLALAAKATIIKIAVQRELSGVVTSSSGDRAALAQLVAATGGGELLVLDPGRDVVCKRIRKLVPKARADICEKGLSRWFDRYTPDPGDRNVE